MKSVERISMFKPLSAWINRTHPLPARFYTHGIVDKPSCEWGTWLTLEEFGPLYKAHKMKWLGLKEARAITKDYLDNASDLICGLGGGWLDNEERMWILDQLGEPPIPSLPIYLITCKDSFEEKVVYVGKTQNRTRFNGGHSASLKLHAPKFDGKEKNVYRCSIWFHNGSEYLSLDWIQPECLACEILNSVESQLIFYFQPELNVFKRKSKCNKWDFYIHIQNFLEGQFLNGTFVG
jgi:hypothetical protein